MATNGEPPNILLCISCKHSEPWDRTPPTEGTRHWPCPKCEGELRLRCGWPKGDGEPCLRAAQPQLEPAGTLFRCHTASHGGVGSRPPPTAAMPPKLKAKVVAKEKARIQPLLPARRIAEEWQDTYAFARTDPEAQFEQTHQLAILAAWEDELNARIETGESGAAWAALQKIGQRVRAQMHTMDESASTYRKLTKAGKLVEAEKAADRGTKANREALKIFHKELLPVVERGVGREASAAELRQTMETRARLQVVDQKAQEQLNPLTLQACIGELTKVVLKHVPPEKRRAMIREVEEFMTFRQGPRMEIVVPFEGNGKRRAKGWP